MWPSRIHALAVALVLALSACSSFPKRLSYGTLESSAMGREMDFAVYTPPGWLPGERLPLVLFLHGGGDEVTCFDRWGVAEMLDEGIEAGSVPRVVIVVPDGEMGFWENWYDGSKRYRDWVTEDCLPFVRETYGTLPGPEHEHAMGISMGGHGVLRIALEEPEAFSSIAAVSSPVLDTESMIGFTGLWWVRFLIPVRRIWGPNTDVERIRSDDVFLVWDSPEDLNGQRLMIVHGTLDRAEIVKGNEQLHAHLKEKGIQHRYLAYEGRHKWVDWRELFPEILGFLVAGDEGELYGVAAD